jgi:hypothetical protein
MKIFYYCLDPLYPGIPSILSFDVDGIITNSKILYETLQLEGIHTEYIMLAADSDSLRPLKSVDQDCGAVYVGAGFQMITEKPELLKMLSDAIPYGLCLFGFGWESTPVFSQSWKGILPRGELANAYSRSKIVLASTIKYQDEYGMINNRIFEALSCGSLVVTEYSKTIADLFGSEIIMFKHHNESFEQIYHRLFMNYGSYEDRRIKARQEIVRKHTWDHRVVQFFEFMERPLDETKRNNKLKLLWIETDQSFTNPDYLYLKTNFLFSYLFSRFHITNVLFSEFFNSSKTENEIHQSLSEYHIILFACLPFSEEEKNFQDFMRYRLTKDQSYTQRIAKYYYGVDSRNWVSCLKKHGKRICSSLLKSDLLFIRSSYEIRLLEDISGALFHPLRVQPVLGVKTILTDQQAVDGSCIIICFYMFRHLCSKDSRLHLGKLESCSSFRTVFMGGDLEHWQSDFSGLLEMSKQVLTKDSLIDADIINLIANCSVVILIQGEVRLVGENVTDMTSEDILMPFVASCALWKKIHLSNTNPHLLNLISEGCDTWNEEYVWSGIRNGMNRLLGFPPNSSDFSIRVLEFQKPFSCPLCTDYDLNILSECDVLSSLVSAILEDFAVLALHVENFDLGRDGLICLKETDKTVPRTHCFLRQTEYIIIKRSRQEQHRMGDIQMKFLMKGNMFNDNILEKDITFRLFSSLGGGSPNLDLFFNTHSRNTTFSKPFDCKLDVYAL